MRGLILAAGRGSRMGVLGDSHPKCMTEVGGHRLVDLQVAALRDAGIREIGIVCGYRAEMLAFDGIDTFHNARWAQTNMVASLACAATWLRSGPVVVSYADIFYGPEPVRALAAAAEQLVIAYDQTWRRLWEQRFQDPLADAETFRLGRGGLLAEIGGKTSRIEDIEGQYMGLLKFTPGAWSRIEVMLAGMAAPERDRLDMTSLLRRILAENSIEIGTVATRGNWGEVDNPSDAALYERMIAAGELTLHHCTKLKHSASPAEVG